MSTAKCAVLGLLLLGCAACSDVSSTQKDDPGQPVRVVATTTFIADLVRSVGGTHVVVDGLMGPGVDPHLFKASARHVSIMADADIIMYNGLHLEGKMADVFAGMYERGVPTLAIAEQIPDTLLRKSALFQGNWDPHIWHNARLWKMAAAVVAEKLASMDTSRADVFRMQYAAFAANMDTVDADVRHAVLRVPMQQRVIVTSHDAFGYYGDAYGFEVRGLQGISTATEAGTADVQRVAELVVDRQIPAMFIESSVSPRGIEAVREAALARGFEVSIGGMLLGDALDAPGTAGATYLGMMRHNTETIVKALANEGGH